MDYLPIEKAALETFIKSNEAISNALRNQIDNSHVLSRRHTGAGFFTEIAVSSQCESITLAEPGPLSNVICQINGVENFGEFLLYVKDGIITCLEGYTFGCESWPEGIEEFRCESWTR